MIIALAVLLAKLADPFADFPKLESLRLVDEVPLEERIANLLVFPLEFVEPLLMRDAFCAAVDCY